MCGIIGYTGNRNATPILLSGLKSLEYRGYDSAGIYLPAVGVCKAVGPVENLVEHIDVKKWKGTSGIAHTRWATHGPPTEVNAHPHSDERGTVWIVHNGIIENNDALREGLLARGIEFRSDTDTEVLAKLIGIHYQSDLYKAVNQTLRLVRGTYGLVVTSHECPDTLLVASLGSPIVIGIGNKEHFVASDPSALLPYTKDVVYLEDGEIAIVKPESYQVFNKKGEESKKTSTLLDWSVNEVQKDGFDHFMLKEIHEAPAVIEQTLRGRLLPEIGRSKLGGIDSLIGDLVNIKHMTIVGCGSAYYAGLLGKYMLEECASLPVTVEISSESRCQLMREDSLNALLVVSQSGETADTLSALRRGKEAGMLTLGIVNVVGSTIAREVRAGVYNHAGPEIAVASTKAFLSQLTVFALLSLFIAREKGMSLSEGQIMAKELATLPEKASKVLEQADHIKSIAEMYSKATSMFFLGRLYHTPVAYEGALKVKEVAYVRAEGYPAGELKHGPIALLDEMVPVIALAPKDETYQKMCSSIKEVTARKAPVIAVTQQNDREVSSLSSAVIEIPETIPLLQPILSSIPLQLFAYYSGISRGLNVDRPRNLAKSVTVE